MTTTTPAVCEWDTGSMYGCRPACDAWPVWAVTYHNGSSGPTGADLCDRHRKPTEGRAYPGHESTERVR